MAGIVNDTGVLVAYISPHRMQNQQVIRVTLGDEHGWHSVKEAKIEVEALLHGYLEGLHRPAVWMDGQPVELMFLSGQSHSIPDDGDTSV